MLIELADVVVENDPAIHGMHVAAVAGDQVPGLHAEHVNEPYAPACEPASHAMQVACPGYGLNWPRLQGAQVVLDVAPITTELVPAVQTVHSDVPRTALKLPWAHAVQGPPLGPVYPALHTQLVW